MIRILFVEPVGGAPVGARINDLGKEIAEIAIDEEQIWICHFPQTVRIFRGLQKAPQQETSK